MHKEESKRRKKRKARESRRKRGEVEAEELSVLLDRYEPDEVVGAAKHPPPRFLLRRGRLIIYPTHET
jgi:hypothetical protein